MRVQTSHRDTTITSHVDVSLLSERLGLLGSQAGKARSHRRSIGSGIWLPCKLAPEHADLRLDVAPFSGSLVIVGELVIKTVTHANDSVGHALDFALPVKLALRHN